MVRNTGSGLFDAAVLAGIRNFKIQASYPYQK
jgi:hypothetical protein